MPLYEYKCVNGHVCAEQRYIQDRKVAAKCPECGEPAWNVVSAVKTTFKYADTSGIKKDK